MSKWLQAGFPLCAALLAAHAFSAHAAETAAREFFFRDGDRVVVIGDSITVGGDYGRYIEDYIRTRFPKWNVAFRNCGINGHTAQTGLPYLETDVLVWKPTVAIVNWGMNDGRNANGVEYYKAGIVPYVEALLKNNIRAVLCSNSPLDIGDEPGNYTDYNRNFHEMARFAQKLAAEKGIPFVDQFHFCHTLWGQNRKRDKPVPVTDQTLAKHSSDSVHARTPGQLTMAYIILKTLGAPGEVSFASIDADSGASETRGCRVSDFTKGPASISFTRSDDASPCWIDDRGALALELVPFQEELNRMTLQVKGLQPGTYELKVDDFMHGRYTAEELAAGINLSLNRQSPICAPGRKVDELVSMQKRATYAARQVMFFRPPGWLKIQDLEAQKRAEFARLIKELEKTDALIAAAAAPQPHRYTLERKPQ